PSLRADAFVFSPRLDGAAPYRPYNVTSFFVRVRESVGLEHLDLHHLRHFTATQLAASGIDVRTIAGRLGHANPAITLRVYSHFLEVADREAASRMGRVLAPVENRSEKSERSKKTRPSRSTPRQVS